MTHSHNRSDLIEEPWEAAFQGRGENIGGMRREGEIIELGGLGEGLGKPR